MKQKRLVSVIGALVLIISATAFIAGCSQPNSNKGNTTTSNGGGTAQGLEGCVFKMPNPSFASYLYFSGGMIYQANHETTWLKYNTGMTYIGNVLTDAGQTFTITMTQVGIIMGNDNAHYIRVTDRNIINTIKNLPVSSIPSNG